MTIEKGKSVQLDLGSDPNHPLILARPEGIFTPRAYEPKGGGEKGRPRFNAMFLFPPGHPEATKLYDTAIAVAEANWEGIRDAAGNITKAYLTKGMFSWPFMAGADFADDSPERKREAYRSCFILKAGASEERPPGLGLEMGNNEVFDIPNDASRGSYLSKFWPGCHVWVRVGIAPITQGKAGVTAYLNVVCSYQTGERVAAFGGATQQPASAIRAQHTGVVHRTGSPQANSFGLRT